MDQKADKKGEKDVKVEVEIKKEIIVHKISIKNNNWIDLESYN